MDQPRPSLTNRVEGPILDANDAARTRARLNEWQHIIRDQTYAADVDDETRETLRALVVVDEARLRDWSDLLDGLETSDE